MVSKEKPVNQFGNFALSLKGWEKKLPEFIKFLSNLRNQCKSWKRQINTTGQNKIALLTQDFRGKNNADGFGESYSKMLIPNKSGTLRFKFEENNKRLKFTDDEFWDSCRQNDHLRIEMTKEET